MNLSGPFTNVSVWTPRSSPSAKIYQSDKPLPMSNLTIETGPVITDSTALIAVRNDDTAGHVSTGSSGAESYDIFGEYKKHRQKARVKDSHGRVAAYVDFGEFKSKLEQDGGEEKVFSSIFH